MGRSSKNTTERGLKVRQPAAQAGLVYASDDEPGIRRVRKGKGFTYSGPDGKRVTDRVTLERIRGLVIPLPGKRSGFQPDPEVISRRPAAMLVAASSASTTQPGAQFVTPTSFRAWSASLERCLASGAASLVTWDSPAFRARR
jgi:hypothetical protein